MANMVQIRKKWEIMLLILEKIEEEKEVTMSNYLYEYKIPSKTIKTNIELWNNLLVLFEKFPHKIKLEKVNGTHKLSFEGDQ